MSSRTDSSGNVPGNRGLSEIRKDAVYPLPVFREKTGLNAHAMRTLRRKGLKTAKAGRNVYIVGAHFYEMMEQQAAQK